MKRAFITALDSFSISATEDAECFGGVGADTPGHITETCVKDEADDGRKGPLNLPSLTRLELAKAREGSIGFIPAGMDGNAKVIDAYAWAHEISSGKDTPSGYWEIASAPVLPGWEYFSDHENSFPQELLDKLVERVNLPGYPGNCHSFGTVILDQLGEGHMKTGKPIFYTSADSVFQIACHEKTFGLDKLYELCGVAREELTNDGYDIGRVTVHPSIGDKADNLQHTGNRHDLAVEPPVPTVLQKLADEEHGQVASAGKITDIYINCGIIKKVKVAGLDAPFNATTKGMKKVGDNTIVFANFVDSDFPWGHRRDVAGYAAGLGLFGRRLPGLMSLSRDDDTLVLTANYGRDPTWTGTDHTREYIPILVYDPRVKPDPLGHRETFTDIDQTLARYLDTSDMEYSKVMF